MMNPKACALRVNRAPKTSHLKRFRHKKPLPGLKIDLKGDENADFYNSCRFGAWIDAIFAVLF